MRRIVTICTAAALGLPATGIARDGGPVWLPEARLPSFEATPAQADSCGWFAIFASARTEPGAIGIRRNYGLEGIADVTDNDRVPEFGSGFYSVTTGPYGTRAEAQDDIRLYGASSPDAYVKEGCPGGAEASGGTGEYLGLVCGWYAIYASAGTREEAVIKAERIGLAGESDIVFGQDGGSFTPGVFAVVQGAYSSRAGALRAIEEASADAPDAYIKEGCPTPTHPPEGDYIGSGAGGGSVPGLRAGVYVLDGQGATCENPANAAFKVYDGIGISGRNTRDCRLNLESVSSSGERYDGFQACVDTYTDEDGTEDVSIGVAGDGYFYWTDQYDTDVPYQLCPNLSISDFQG